MAWGLAAAAPAQEPARASVANNKEMTAIFAADQEARQSLKTVDWDKVAADDAVRRGRTKQLLDSGALETADDYYHAAFLFQHGDQPDDYLLAHALAVASVAKGKSKASWISAATLDRYLKSIGQKQIYGTQFFSRDGQPITQEPYNRSLIPDALRRATLVPTLAEQEATRAEMDKSLNKKK